MKKVPRFSLAAAMMLSGFGVVSCHARSEVTTHADIVFAEGVPGDPLRIDLHLPQGVEKPPLVMFIHGGAWKGGDRKSQKILWVVPHGYAVANIEYRLSQQAKFPAQIHDCKGALRWLRANANRYGYDAQRVVVAGASAGGQLAALMGTTGGVEALEGDTAGHLDQSSRVQGVIDYFGATDFLLRSKTQPSMTDHPDGSVYQLLGGPVSENQALARLGSAALHVDANDPPVLMLHGAKDNVVQLSQSERLLEVYQEHELDAHLHIEQEHGHGWNPMTDEERRLILEFLERILGER